MAHICPNGGPSSLRSDLVEFFHWRADFEVVLNLRTGREFKMNPNDLRRAVSLLIVLPAMLSAQFARRVDPVALRYWAAPLYWRPTQASSEQQALATAAATAGLPVDPNPLVFVAMTPCRVADTRASQGFPSPFGAPSLAGGVSRTFPMQSSTSCSIPAAAQAYSLNITVVPQGPVGFLTAYPTGQSLPLAATLVWSQGSITSNAAIVPGGTSGSVDVYANSATDVVIDINGYYAAIYGPSNNTALGSGALVSNTSGNFNTAAGSQALQNNTTGSYNTATGGAALPVNTSGSFNTASGALALQFNTTGSSNTGLGYGALDLNTAGLGNTAIGYNALSANVTGSNNIAIGDMAGSNVGSGNSGNIYIGSPGSSADAGATRIGNSQTSFFAAGIRGITTGSSNAIPVMIDSNGQLGTVSSSRRFKEDIQDMGDASNGLLKLRPVTFHYQKPFTDGSKPIQYGLIAEEVDEVYPELVAHSADGKIESVKYQMLDSMLLNELQKEHQQIWEQAEAIRLLEKRLAALETIPSAKVSPSAPVR
jgi:Chaperone of endosialidase